MKVLWEELDALNTLPVILSPTTEVQTLLTTISRQKEDTKLFQFLNGLDETYNPIRSQLLMHQPLPTVEIASAVLQQEEAQREVLHLNKTENSMMAMFGKAKSDKPIVCNVCGVKGHRGNKCWTVVGYPYWHPKHNYKSNTNPKFRTSTSNQSTRWNSGNRGNNIGMAANVQYSESGEQSGIAFSPQQLEQ